MSGNLTKFRWAILGINLAVLGALFVFIQFKDKWALTDTQASLLLYGSVPDFKLTERSGKDFTLADLRNEVWVADFIFTRCAGQCPIMSTQMARLQKEIGKNIRFVSFTVDPDFDSPEILSKYAERYEAGAERWLFLTGDKATLNGLTAAFHMNKIDEPMMHSTSFVLVDRTGQIRGFYDSNEKGEMTQLVRDAKRLAKYGGSNL